MTDFCSYINSYLQEAFASKEFVDQYPMLNVVKPQEKRRNLTIAVTKLSLLKTAKAHAYTHLEAQKISLECRLSIKGLIFDCYLVPSKKQPKRFHRSCLGFPHFEEKKISVECWLSIKGLIFDCYFNK